jgi:Tol biopolymer transport system component
VRLDGIGAPIRLNHQLPAGGSVGQYAVSPDGQWVVFMADGVVDEQVELYSASIDGSAWTPLHGPGVAGGDVKEFAIAPDGQRVAFTGDLIVDERFDVYSRPIDGSSLPALLYTNSNNDASRPLISPDSATVAYVTSIPGQGEQLRASPMLSGDSQPVSLMYGANPDEHIYMFQFSPDSRYLIYITDAATPGNRIPFSKHLTGEPALNVLSGTQTLDFKITPDSRAVVFRSLNKDLFISPIDTQFVEDYLADLPDDRAVEQYEVAPQGDYVLYRADRNADDTVELFAVPARMGVIPASQTVKINGMFATYNDVTSFQVGAQGDIVYRADNADEKFELYRRINLRELFLPLNIKG